MIANLFVMIILIVNVIAGIFIVNSIKFVLMEDAFHLLFALMESHHVYVEKIMKIAGLMKNALAQPLI